MVGAIAHYTSLPVYAKLSYKTCVVECRVSVQIPFLQLQALKTTGWAESTWTDNRLHWNPEEYGGIDRLSVSYHDVSPK